MIQRNLTLDHEFVCFTESARGLNRNIRVEPLSLITGVQGWWYKPIFFNPALSLQGTILFLDLDIIIFRNINHLFTHCPGKFLIIRDFNRSMIKNYPKFNSSVFRVDTGDQQQVFRSFMKDPIGNSKRYLGDQDWIYSNVTENFEYWPTEWIQSYKWEMRGRAKLDKSRPKDQRDFVTPGEPTILDDTSIAVFHGDPNPHHCKDPWVIEHWR
jgi:hypothetical protein